MAASREESTAPASSLTILVVEDHGVDRVGMGGLLSREPDFRITGNAKTADEAIKLAIVYRPNVVVMDIDTFGVSCFDAIQIIRSHVPDTRFIVLTAHERDEHLEQALKMKVNGFITKSDGNAALANAIRNATADLMSFSQGVMNRLVVEEGELLLANPSDGRLKLMSPRERELLRVLAKGASLKQAAGILGVSYKTADKQKTSIMNKLDIHDRVELARFAIREGLIDA